MQYATYTFRKEISSPRGGFVAEAQQHHQPLEQICQEAGGIIIEDTIETPGADIDYGCDIYRRTKIFLVDNVVVKNSVYLSHSDRGEQSSVETRILYRNQGVDMLAIFHTIREHYQTKSAFRYEDSEKPLAGEQLVPQGMESK